MERKRYGYAESSNLRSTRAGHIIDGVQADAAIENGMLKKVGELNTALEVRNVAKAGAKDKVILALSALTPYDTSRTAYAHESYLRKEAGEVARFYTLEAEDRFAVADYMITALSDKVVVGNTIILDPTTEFYKEVAHGSDTATAAANGFMARIEGVEPHGEFNLVRVRVIQNVQLA